MSNKQILKVSWKHWLCCLEYQVLHIAFFSVEVASMLWVLLEAVLQLQKKSNKRLFMALFCYQIHRPLHSNTFE